TATLHAVGEKTPLPAREVNPAVPAGLSYLIEWLHQKKPADRPASAVAVATELSRIVVSPEGPTGDWQPAHPADLLRPSWSPRFRLAVASTFGLFLLLAAILSLSLTNRPRGSGDGFDLSPVPSTPSEPLRVSALDVHHFEGVADKLRGVFAQDSFGASPED